MNPRKPEGGSQTSNFYPCTVSDLNVQSANAPVSTSDLKLRHTLSVSTPTAMCVCAYETLFKCAFVHMRRCSDARLFPTRLALYTCLRLQYTCPLAFVSMQLWELRGVTRMSKSVIPCKADAHLQIKVTTFCLSNFPWLVG